MSRKKKERLNEYQKNYCKTKKKTYSFKKSNNFNNLDIYPMVMYFIVHFKCI